MTPEEDRLRYGAQEEDRLRYGAQEEDRLRYGAQEEDRLRSLFLDVCHGVRHEYDDCSAQGTYSAEMGAHGTYSAQMGAHTHTAEYGSDQGLRQDAPYHCAHENLDHGIDAETKGLQQQSVHELENLGQDVPDHGVDGEPKGLQQDVLYKCVHGSMEQDVHDHDIDTDQGLQQDLACHSNCAPAHENLEQDVPCHDMDTEITGLQQQSVHVHGHLEQEPHPHALFTSPTTKPLPDSTTNTDYDTLTMTSASHHDIGLQQDVPYHCVQGNLERDVHDHDIDADFMSVHRIDVLSVKGVSGSSLW